jgi:hypothetical protein
MASVASARPWAPMAWGPRLALWHGLLTEWLMAWGLGGTLAVCGAAMLARGAGRLGGALRRVADDRLGLLLFALAGALLGGLERSLGPEFLVGAGTATVVAAAVTLDRLTRREGPPAGVRAAWLLGSGCAVAALAALALALKAPATLPAVTTRIRLADAVEPGSRLYVWGSPFESEIYVRAKAVAAAPQIFTWMVEGPAPPPLGTGLYGYPLVATRAGLDEALSDALPLYVVIMEDPAPSPADLPRFGPILRSSYRVVERLPEGTVYRRTAPGDGP